MQTDPKLTLHIKLKDHVSVLEKEIGTETKSPDASLSNFIENTPFTEDLQPVFDEQFGNYSKAQSF